MEVNKVGWYKVESVSPTGFEPDQYGNSWYSVKFEGEAKSYMWLAQAEPELKSYFGHFEPTKSGKTLRFKRDKEPEEEQKKAFQPRDDASIKAQMAIKAAAHWVATTSPESSLGTVEKVAMELFVMVDRVKQTQATPDGDVADQLYDADGPVDFNKLKEVFNEED